MARDLDPLFQSITGVAHEPDLGACLTVQIEGSAQQCVEFRDAEAHVVRGFRRRTDACLDEIRRYRAQTEAHRTRSHAFSPAAGATVLAMQSALALADAGQWAIAAYPNVSRDDIAECRQAVEWRTRHYNVLMSHWRDAVATATAALHPLGERRARRCCAPSAERRARLRMWWLTAKWSRDWPRDDREIEQCLRFAETALDERRRRDEALASVRSAARSSLAFVANPFGLFSRDPSMKSDATSSSSSSSSSSLPLNNDTSSSLSPPASLSPHSHRHIPSAPHTSLPNLDSTRDQPSRVSPPLAPQPLAPQPSAPSPPDNEDESEGASRRPKSDEKFEAASPLRERRAIRNMPMSTPSAPLGSTAAVVVAPDTSTREIATSSKPAATSWSWPTLPSVSSLFSVGSSSSSSATATNADAVANSDARASAKEAPLSDDSRYINRVADAMAVGAVATCAAALYAHSKRVK